MQEPKLVENPMTNVHIGHLEAMLGDYTESAEDRKRLTIWIRILNGMECSPEYKSYLLISAIAQGLTYGEWPWYKSTAGADRRMETNAR